MAQQRVLPSGIERTFEVQDATGLEVAEVGLLSSWHMDGLSLEREGRKARSEAILQRLGVGTNPGLPSIECACEITTRSVEQVAYRGLCLLIVSAKALGVDPDQIDNVIAQHDARSRFTPEERIFIDNPKPSETEGLRLGWRLEAAKPLFWSLGFLDDLGLPVEEWSPKEIIDLIEDNGMEALIRQASLRSASEILDEADFIYRCHWATRRAYWEGADAAPLSPDVTQERHQALNWLIHYENQEWDDVTTDT